MMFEQGISDHGPKKRERDFYRYLTQYFPGHVTRIETRTTCGVPDIVICHVGITVWVELKSTFTGSYTLLRKEQYAWGMGHATKGGKVFVISRLEDRIVGNDEVQVWKYPFNVKAYGIAARYVSPSLKSTIFRGSKSSFVQSLESLLFT
jgi:hypothetical protein